MPRNASLSIAPSLELKLYLSIRPPVLRSSINRTISGIETSFNLWHPLALLLLSIAPSLELKQKRKTMKMNVKQSINRTISGIET